jgi:hypothetical protein
MLLAQRADDFSAAGRTALGAAAIVAAAATDTKIDTRNRSYSANPTAGTLIHVNRCDARRSGGERRPES